MYFELVGTNVRVMGSMHMLPKDRPNMPNWVLRAYEWADALVTEIDPGRVGDIFSLPPGQELKPLLPDDLWASIESFWPRNRIPLNSLRPWALPLLIPVFCTRLVDGVEPLFMGKAALDGKAVGFLERGIDFAATAETIPSSEIIEATRTLMADLDAPAKQIEAIWAAWVIGDLTSLYATVRTMPIFSQQGLRNALLTKRNRAWAEVLRPSLASAERTLVFVGALHLCGPDNLLDCLGRRVRVLPIEA